MIFDCFTFFNEIELLILRMTLLNDSVDKFVIAESNLTHSGLNKKFIIEENWEKLKKFHNKIIYIKVIDFPKYNNSWTYENFQRNQILLGLIDCSDEDIVMLSDIDEIPNPAKLVKSISGGVVICYLQEMYFYYVNNYKSNHIIWEGGTKAFSYGTIRNNLLNERYVRYNNHSFPKDLNEGASLTKVRLYRNLKYINNGGWHLSYLGGAKAIKIKLMATSHQEINVPEINSDRHIEACLHSGIDLLDKSTKCYTRNLSSLPSEFKDVLPKDFAVAQGNQLENYKYLGLKIYELALIHARGILRKIFD
jgi:beta-1,4-mannosyl-glycoprotein beta-1,4-N-acetylglucosaminyltransferase